MTRIIAGEFGGRRLVTPDSRRTRPTSDRVREALFSRLQAWDAMADVPVLDLFAGSGALGLESVSRGSSRAVLVEAHKATAEVIRRNVGTLQLTSRVEVRQTTVHTYLQGPLPVDPFGLVFIDPPYDLAGAEVDEALLFLAAPGWLRTEAVVVVERSSRTPEPSWPTGWERLRQSKYGETTLWYAETASAANCTGAEHITTESQGGGEAASSGLAAGER